jgi:hypothetical protein
MWEFLTDPTFNQIRFTETQLCLMKADTPCCRDMNAATHISMCVHIPQAKVKTAMFLRCD